jgi:hypothetical protein
MKKILIYSLLIFTFTNISFAQDQELLGNCKNSLDVQKEPGVTTIQVTYMGSNSAPYGLTASVKASRFTTLAFHYPAVPTGPDNAICKPSTYKQDLNRCCNTLKFVDYGKATDPSRGGDSFGYHFYIDQSGEIYQGAPMYKRTNNISGQNDYTLGVTLVCDDMERTAAQAQKAIELGNALRIAYGIQQIGGHGDFASKNGNEGKRMARELIATTPQNKYYIDYTLGGSKKLTCIVEKGVSSGCSGDACQNISTANRSISGVVRIGTLTSNIQPPSPLHIFTNNSQPSNQQYIMEPGRTGNDSLDFGYPLMRYDPKTQHYHMPTTQPTTQQNTQSNNPIQQYFTPQQQQAQPQIINTDNDINNECSTAWTENKKQILKKYKTSYDVEYLLKFGSWETLLDKSLTFTNIFAYVQAKLIQKELSAILKCDVYNKGFNIK